MGDRTWLSSRVRGVNAVTHELEANRVRLAGRKHVQNAAAQCELSVFVGRILSAEPGVHEQRAEAVWRDIVAGPQVDRRFNQPLSRAHARQECGRGGDDHPRRPTDDSVQGSRASRQHTNVGGQTTVWIDFMRWQRQNGPLRRRP